MAAGVVGEVLEEFEGLDVFLVRDACVTLLPAISPRSTARRGSAIVALDHGSAMAELTARATSGSAAVMADRPRMMRGLYICSAAGASAVMARQPPAGLHPSREADGRLTAHARRRPRRPPRPAPAAGPPRPHPGVRRPARRTPAPTGCGRGCVVVMKHYSAEFEVDAVARLATSHRAVPSSWLWSWAEPLARRVWTK